MSVLVIDDLRTSLQINGGEYHAVREISFSIEEGETLAVVGESGCGKSMLAMSIMRLLPSVASITAGRILLDSLPIEAVSETGMERVRGAKIGMVFQEPMTALNPVLTVGEQISEPLRDHLGLSRREARKAAIGLMEKVRIPSAASRYSSYPHEFSGGMRQRVVIALAIACHPRLLIADEPTTALDVTVQRQILDLLDVLRTEGKMGMLLITHNLGIVAGHADRVAVMYGGDLVESATVRDLFRNPAHPYARAAGRPAARRPGPFGTRLDSGTRADAGQYARWLPLQGSLPARHGKMQQHAAAGRCRRREPAYGPMLAVCSGRRTCCLRLKGCGSASPFAGAGRSRRRMN